MKLFNRSVLSILLLSLFAVLVASPTRADNPGDDLKTALLVALDAMHIAGMDSVGGVSSARIHQEIQSISFRLVTEPFPPSAPYRDCAYYDRREKSVTIESKCWEQSAPQLKLALLFHEALGALGYDDVDYQWSAPFGYALTFSSIGLPRTLTSLTMTAPLMMQMYEPEFRQRITEWAVLKGGGSATGIKGGGDPFSLETKITLFGYLGLYAIQHVLSTDQYDRLFEKIRVARIESIDREKPDVDYDGKTLFVSRRFVRELQNETKFGPILEYAKPAAILRVILDSKP